MRIDIYRDFLRPPLWTTLSEKKLNVTKLIIMPEENAKQEPTPNLKKCIF